MITIIVAAWTAMLARLTALPMISCRSIGSTCPKTADAEPHGRAGLFGSYRSDDPPLSNSPLESIVRAPHGLRDRTCQIAMAGRDGYQPPPGYLRSAPAVSASTPWPDFRWPHSSFRNRWLTPP